MTRHGKIGIIGKLTKTGKKEKDFSCTVFFFFQGRLICSNAKGYYECLSLRKSLYEDANIKVEFRQEEDKMTEETSQLRDFGRDNFFFSFFHAITKRKRAGEALPESKQRYRLLMDDVLNSSKVGLFILDDSFKVVWINQALERYFGLRREKVIGKDKRQLIRGQIKNIFEKPENFVEKVFATYDDNTYVESFECHVLSDGQREERWLEHWSQPIQSGFFAGGRIEHYTDITERKKAEDALLESEERLLLAMSAADMGTWRWNPETNQDTRDANFNRILGLEAKESTQPVEDFFQLVHPHDRKMVEQEVQRTIRDRQTYLAEFRIVRPDGAVRWLRDQGELLFGENDQVLYMTGAVMDITKRKQMEEVVVNLSKFPSENPNPVLRIGSKGTILYKNEATDVLLKESGLAGEDIFRILPDNLKKLISKALKTKKAFYDLEAVVGDKVYSYSLFPVVKSQYVNLYAIDVTERKRAEVALKESKERYKALFEGAAEGILVADTETKEFKYANPAICRMLGYSEEELIQMGITDIHSKEDLEHVISEFEVQERGKRSLSPCIPCLRKDGTIVYADINSTNVMIDGRECSVGFFTDITEHKRIKADVENYKEKIYQAQKHAYIASMGSIVAHQLNQPLTAINMRLGKALEMVEESNCSPKCLKNIKESLAEAKRAVSTIKKFRQSSRDPDLETAGKVQVSDIAKRIISLSSERAQQAKIKIFPKNLCDLPEAEINETALEQILYIIIQNAIEASDGKKQHKLNIFGKFADGLIELQFSDDCCGIAPENLDKIFEPFFSTKFDGKGLGLGLDIVQQILISYGGEIRVESKLGKGATFYVTLPISNTLEG